MNPGIHSLSELEYQNDAIADTPSLSASIAKILVNESPLHAWTAHPRLNPNFEREEKEIFDLGTVAHALMLQGLKTAIVLDIPDWRTSEARKARTEIRAEGKIPVLRKHWSRIQEMVGAGKVQIASHREAKDVFTDVGKSEQTLAWTDDHGVICRARLDWLRNDYKRIADYKGTGTSVNPESMARFAVSQGWDIQAAFYRRGILKITGEEPDFLFVAQEDYPPYALTVVGMAPSFIWYGDKRVQAAIDLWAKCLDAGKWTAYPDRIVYPDLPPYAEAAWLEKELAT